MGPEIHRARFAEWGRAPRAAWLAIPAEFRAVLWAIALLHGVALFWGLPASDTWDVDGIAPRDFAPGLIATFTPGDYFTYPPLHLLLLTVLCLPILIVGVAVAPAHTPSAIVATLLSPSFMTPMALVARLVSVVLSVALAYAAGGVAEEMVRVAFDRESTSLKQTLTRWVGPTSAFLVGVGAPLTYYAHATNLDVPTCCWMMFALRAFVRACARHDHAHLRRAALFAVMSISTKDQAYAAFALTLPVGLFFWGKGISAGERRSLLKTTLKVACGALFALLLIDGAITNPTGFAARLRFLSGPASKGYEIYSRDLGGRLSAALTVIASIPGHYGSYAYLLAAVAAVVLLWRRGKTFVVLLPLLLAVSFTLFFNLVALRTEERFVLPQMIVTGIYAGVFVAYAIALPASKRFRWGRSALLVLPIGLATWGAIRVNLTMLTDSRYAAEDWLTHHAAPGDTIEMEGLNPYLLRPTSRGSYVRVSREPGKNPMPGYDERKDELANLVSRAPRFVATNTCYTWRYRKESFEFDSVPPLLAETAVDNDAIAFLNGLENGSFGYERVFESTGNTGWFTPFKIHGSLGCMIRIFERK